MGQGHALLLDNRANRRSPLNLRHGNLLGGLLFDGLGRPMRTCSAAKGAKTYHYYASCADAVALTKQPAWRIPARDIERIVVDSVRAFLGDHGRVHDASIAVGLHDDRLSAVLASSSMRALDVAPAVLGDLVERIEVYDERIDISIALAALLTQVDPEVPPIGSYTIRLPSVRLRRGKEVRVLLPGSDGGLQASSDPALIKLLANAFAARDAVEAAAGDRSLAAVARANGYSSEYFSLLLRLSMLSPDIVQAIHDERQPPSLNRQRLARTTNLPIEWSAQRTALGFA